MGIAQSNTYGIDGKYVRIWDNLTSIKSNDARIQMITTLLSSHEYVSIAQYAGLYNPVVQWVSATRRGEYATWPTGIVVKSAESIESARPVMRPAPVVIKAALTQPQLRITATSRTEPVTHLAKVAPPKRALDVLNESYDILGIDDSKPLSHEVLKLAYKRAALKAHPDKGGSATAFDEVTRAFLYIEEVLNKLIPKGDDARLSAPVTMDAALRARNTFTGTREAASPSGLTELEDAPPIALNPKKLDMNVFNKLFTENRMPDPDKDDGYGDWLKSQESDGRRVPADAMRGKYNVDVFNKTFQAEASKITTAVAKYTPPAELTLAPQFGTELGSARPATYTKPPSSSGIGYTDLKFAYGEGATFSQDAVDTNVGRPRNLEEAKREYNSAPKAMSPEEAAAIRRIEQAKEAEEMKRRQRLAAHDVTSEGLHNRLKNRLLIQ